MTALRITNVLYNPATALISFTASFSDHDGSTTVASTIRAATTPADETQLHQLVEFRVAELLAIPSLSTTSRTR